MLHTKIVDTKKEKILTSNAEKFIKDSKRWRVLSYPWCSNESLMDSIHSFVSAGSVSL